MVLQRSGSGTGYLAPQSGVATVAQDSQGLEGISAVPIEEALPGAKFEFFESEQSQGDIACRLTIFDQRGGLNAQIKEVGDGHTRIADGDMEVRGKGYAHPPYKTTTQNTITLTTPDTLFWARFLSRLVMATTGGPGALAASKLLAETSTSDPTLVDTTYAPLGAGFITGVWPLYVANNASMRFAVGSTGNLDILSNLNTPPTSLGQMAAANVTGIAQLQLPDDPILIAAGTSLLSGTGTGAIGQALTTIVASGLPYGRQFIAAFSLGGRKARVFWRYPKGTPTQASDVFGATDWASGWEIESTNPYGTDPQQHDVGLEDVKGAQFVRDGLISTDGQRLTFYNGKHQELGWKRERKYSASHEPQCQGIHIVDKREVIACVNQVGTDVTLHWHERYDWDLKAWQPVSAQTTLTDGASTVGLHSSRGSPALPYNASTRMLHCCGGSGVTTARFLRKREPPPGVIPYTERGRQTYENAAFDLTPGLIFPAPVTYLPKILTAAMYGGDPTGGGTTLPLPGSAKIEVGEMGFTVGDGQKWAWKTPIAKADRTVSFPQNQSRMMTPQIRFTSTQGADATLVANMLPMTFEFLCFRPERKRRHFLWW